MQQTLTERALALLPYLSPMQKQFLSAAQECPQLRNQWPGLPDHEWKSLLTMRLLRSRKSKNQILTARFYTCQVKDVEFSN